VTLDWHTLNAIIQYLIVPAIVWLWAHDKRLDAHDREITKLVTILQEREKAAQANVKREADAMSELRDIMTKMSDRLDALATAIAKLQGHDENHRG